MPQACQMGDPVFARSLIEKILKIVTSENYFFHLKKLFFGKTNIFFVGKIVALTETDTETEYSAEYSAEHSAETLFGRPLMF